MAEMQDSWKEVAGKAESLGLKLKLHLEQEQQAQADGEPESDTKALVDDLTKKVTDAFDSIGNAAKDPAVHDDVKDMGRLFKDALVSTFSAVGAEMSNRKSGASKSDDTPQDTVNNEPAVLDEPLDETLDEAAGDESDSGDA
jgi:hypothetical protein